MSSQERRLSIKDSAGCMARFNMKCIIENSRQRQRRSSGWVQKVAPRGKPLADGDHGFDQTGY